jgi:6-phosphogluconolactonase/glucosamine-6-phosphate isomerase/deaminase
MIITNITSVEPVVEYLARTLTQHLAAGERVLWLVPGGSSIQIAASVSQKLTHTATGQPPQNLTVTLTDERYGEPGHQDSNWRQLDEAGFKLPGATLLPVLTGADLSATVEQFADQLGQALREADFRLGFFGIGPDGHTAGILPGSPAVSATQLAAGYNAGKFQRITMTPPAVLQLDETVAYAVGEAKWPVLAQLTTERLELNHQPAQVLGRVKSFTLFTDYAESAS